MRETFSQTRHQTWWLRAVLPSCVALLAAMLGANLVQFTSQQPTLPILARTFLPSAVIGVALLVGILSVRFRGGLIPSLHVPRRINPSVLASAIGIVALVSVIGFATVHLVGEWGATLAFPTLLAFVGLGVLFWLSLYRIVDALALYLAFWPMLAAAKLSVVWLDDPGVHLSIFIVPIHVTSERLGNSASVVAENLPDQFALLSPEVLCVAVMFAGWLLSRRRQVLGRGLPAIVHFAVAIVLGAGALSALLSPLPGFSFVWFIGELGAPVLLFYLVASAVRTERELNRVLWGMLVGLALISGYHIFSKYQALAAANLGFSLTTIQLTSRYDPVLGNPNVAGAIVLYMLVAPLAVLTRGRDINLGRLAAALVLAAGLLSLAISLSRGPLLALVVILAVIFWRMPRGRIPIVLSLAGVLLVATPAFDLIAEAALQLRPSLIIPLVEELGFTGRLFLWGQSLEVMSEHLLTGIGPGLFITLDIFHPDATSFVYGHAHQLFLNMGVEIGLIGLGAFVVLTLTVGHRALRTIRTAPSGPYRNTLTFIALGLLGFLIVSATTGVPLQGRTGLAAGLVPFALAGMLMGARGSQNVRAPTKVSAPRVDSNWGAGQ